MEKWKGMWSERGISPSMPSLWDEIWNLSFTTWDHISLVTEAEKEYSDYSLAVTELLSAVMENAIFECLAGMVPAEKDKMEKQDI